MEFQLISAFSAKITWTSKSETTDYIVQWKQGDVVKETKTNLNSILLLNLDPETSYDVRIISGDKIEFKGNFETSPENKPALQNLYESIKLEDGTYDATQLEKKAHDVFLKYFNDVVNNGDTIYTSVILKGASKNIETKAVVEGTTTSVTGTQNLFLPFTTDSSSTQKVTLSNKVEQEKTEEPVKYASTVDLVYSPSDDSFVLGDKVYKIGDKFELFGKMVTVADGSIVLVFEDTVALVYPFDTTTAANVVGSSGSSFTKNMTCNVVNVIGSKLTGEVGSTYSSAWVYDTTADTIAEATRIVHTIDENSEAGKISIGVRHTDGSSNVFIEPVIQCESGSTTISSQDASDNTISTTFNSTGISFDTDDASIYFGGSQEFRIIFLSGTPNILAIQAYDSVAGEYVSRTEFSDSA